MFSVSVITRNYLSMHMLFEFNSYFNTYTRVTRQKSCLNHIIFVRRNINHIIGEPYYPIYILMKQLLVLKPDVRHEYIIKLDKNKFISWISRNNGNDVLSSLYRPYRKYLTDEFLMYFFLVQCWRYLKATENKEYIY